MACVRQLRDLALARLMASSLLAMDLTTGLKHLEIRWPVRASSALSSLWAAGRMTVRTQTLVWRVLLVRGSLCSEAWPLVSTLPSQPVLENTLLGNICTIQVSWGFLKSP